MKNHLNFVLILISILHLIQGNDFRFVSSNGEMNDLLIELIANILDSFEHVEIYEKNEEIFDAIVVDERNEQIIIGAK